MAMIMTTMGMGIMGTTIAEAGAAIAANAAVELDGSGRVITKSAGVTVGRLMPGSVAAAAGATQGFSLKSLHPAPCVPDQAAMNSFHLRTMYWFSSMTEFQQATLPMRS